MAPIGMAPKNPAFGRYRPLASNRMTEHNKKPLTDAELLSRRLNKFMRHEAHKMGIKYNKSFWMEIQDVACALDKPLRVIWKAIESDTADRFELWRKNGIWLTRATRGVTLPETWARGHGP